MIPEMPEKREGWRAVVFAENQPEYLPLAANTDGRHVETKWRLTWREWLSILWRGQIYLTVLIFGRPLQPIRLSVLREPEYQRERRTA